MSPTVDDLMGAIGAALELDPSLATQVTTPDQTDVVPAIRSVSGTSLAPHTIIATGGANGRDSIAMNVFLHVVQVNGTVVFDFGETQWTLYLKPPHVGAKRVGASCGMGWGVAQHFAPQVGCADY